MTQSLPARQRRFTVQIAIDESKSDWFYNSHIMNLSLGGVFIAADIVLPVGSKIEFHFTLPMSKRFVQAFGIVVWSRSRAAGYQSSKDQKQSTAVDAFRDHPNGMGVQFVHLSQEDQIAIETELQNMQKIG